MWYIVDETGEYAGYSSYNRDELESMLEHMPEDYAIDCHIPEPYYEQ